MASRVPIPVAAHRALTELWGETTHAFETENVYDVDDLLTALKVMGDEGDEDAELAHLWLRSHRIEYLQGLADGFEPV